jgi:sialidase-1
LDPDQTGQWVMTRSRDNGQTWSPPENLTRQLKRPEWRMCFQGPGSGLQLRDGTLVFPAQIKDAANIPHSCFAYSRDHGKNWRLSPLAVPTTPPTTEAALAEMPDGSLLISMRNEAKTGRRVWSRWTWGTEPGSGTWSEPWSQLQDPTCMASLLRHPNGRIYFCNPDHTSRRLRLTLRSSADDGRNWDEGVVVEPGVAMYSSLTLLPGGDIGVLYEAGDVGGLEFARIPVEAR